MYLVSQSTYQFDILMGVYFQILKNREIHFKFEKSNSKHIYVQSRNLGDSPFFKK